jgi:hypothetical protein
MVDQTKVLFFFLFSFKKKKLFQCLAPLTEGDGGRMGGVWAYRSLSKLTSQHSLTEYWDDIAKAPYFYNESSGLFFSFENAKSIHEKAEYVKKNGLGGLITWMVSEDKPTGSTKRDELTKVIKNELFGSAALPALEISPSAVSAEVTLTKYTENGREGYEVKLQNTAKKEESQTVLALVETAGKTIKVFIIMIYDINKIYIYIIYKCSYQNYTLNQKAEQHLLLEVMDQGRLRMKMDMEYAILVLYMIIR